MASLTPLDLKQVAGCVLEQALLSRSRDRVVVFAHQIRRRNIAPRSVRYVGEETPP